VNGGDGTGHVVLTAIARAWGAEPLPRLALLRGGAMNTVAHGHGISGTPERIVRAILAHRRAGEPLPPVARDLLRVEADGGEPRFGFLFGTGIVVAFLERYYATGRPSPATAALLLARALGSVIVRGRFAQALTRRERIRVQTDGEEWADAAYLALLAGAVPDLGFGFRALARCDEQPGFFHAVGISGTLGGVALSLPWIRAGRPWRRRVATDEIARELRLEGDGIPFTVDGDLYAARRGIRVSTGPGVEILLPRGPRVDRPSPGH
ncbi:MAG TPA: diacylglycerol kinase, partial [Anaeromyxobacteraceae bacterium]|nr:diacylglycerol kinase [Anaeromyxobacteraceae bacterium]